MIKELREANVKVEKARLLTISEFEEFEESLRLPMAVQGSKAVAKVVDGVLTVRVPRFDADLPKSHVIKVN